MSSQHQIKQELSPALTHDDTLTSPAESFIGTPQESYSSLFAASTPVDSVDTLHDVDLTSFDPDDASVLSPVPEDSTVATPEKSQPKKRKGWGQVLPQPKTNLPPRKRAKTEDEKEQRRVERVLRNRRAAQSSRERKRQEVENLEKRNQELETLLANEKQTNMLLLEQLNRFRRNSLKENPSLLQELFVSRDGAHSTTTEDPHNSIVDDLLRNSENPTVNPASLSPPLGPVPDNQDPESAVISAPSDLPSATSPDLTQRPAVSVGGGAEAPSRRQEHDSREHNTPISDDNAHGSRDYPFGMSQAIDADRFVLESGLLDSPLSSNLDDDYMVGDSATGNPLEFEMFVNYESNFAIADALGASYCATAEAEFDYGIFDPEDQISAENSSQQPQPGASTLGCDGGGLAVGS